MRNDQADFYWSLDVLHLIPRSRFSVTRLPGSALRSHA